MFATARQAFRVRAAAGDFIASRAKWSWFITLTFECPVSVTHASNALKNWLRGVAKTIGAHFKVAYATETTSKGVLHFHALIDVPARTEPGDDGPFFEPKAATKQWKASSPSAGFTDIKRYEPTGRAAYYLAKGSEWDFGHVCTRERGCRRAGGCQHGTAPWS